MTLEDKYEKLLEVVKDIAETGWGTGEDAVNFSHWCNEVLKEIEEED